MRFKNFVLAMYPVRIPNVFTRRPLRLESDSASSAAMTIDFSGPPSARRSRRSEEKGVALVTVLAIVLLMTVLIMSFFTMASSELTAAKKDTDNLRVRALADAAVNMVIGQIRKATTSIVPGSTSESAVAPWSSQPGGIRVYNSAGDLQRIYKLYSSSQMYANNLRQLQHEDIRKEWDPSPAQWVDMNAPVVVPDRLFPDDLKRCGGEISDCGPAGEAGPSV